MTKPHPRSDLEQLRCLSRFRRRRSDSEHLGGTPKNRGVPDRVGRGHEHQALRRRGQGADTRQVMVLDPARNIHPFGEQPKATCHLGCAQAQRQLLQRQRIAPGLRDDPVTDALVEPARDDRREQGARVLLFKPPQQPLWEGLKLAFAARLAHPKHHRDRLRQQPSRHESENLARGAVEPLRVIHETRKRPLSGNLGQQAEGRQGDQEAVWGIARGESQGDAQSVALRLGKGTELAKHRPAELMQPGERQLHLGFDAGDVGDAKPGSPASGVAKKGSLPDTRLTTDDEDRALPPTHVLQ